MNDKTIQFITSDCKELFRIPDGGSIKITYLPEDGRGTITRACKYRDDHHFETLGRGGDMYHICQFAEIMERLGSRYGNGCRRQKVPCGYVQRSARRARFTDVRAGSDQKSAGGSVLAGRKKQGARTRQRRTGAMKNGERSAGRTANSPRRKREVHFNFWASGEEAALIRERMARLGVTNMGAYMRKVGIDGYIINLDLSDVRQIVLINPDTPTVTSSVDYEALKRRAQFRLVSGEDA